jgi:acyl carrier protein
VNQTANLQTISDCIKELFPEAEGLEIGMETTLENIPGWDSMSAVNFQTRLATLFGVSIPEEMLSGETSIGDILDHIRTG